MRSYQVARTYFSIIEFAGWGLILIGILTVFILGAVGHDAARAFGAPSAGSGLVGLIPGLMIAVLGLVMIGLAQFWRAGVDSAEYTQQMLKIARDQLEVSRRSLRAGIGRPESFGDVRAGGSGSKDTASFGNHPSPMERAAASIAAENIPDDVDKVIKYGGHRILKRDGKYYVEGFEFTNLSHAQLRIEQIIEGKVPPPKPQKGR